MHAGYFVFGAASSISYGNNRQATLSYNNTLMRMTQMEVARPDGTDKIVNHAYFYTENGLLSSTLNGVDSAYSSSYGYNYRNQLVTAWRQGSTLTYTQDHWGNLTSVHDFPTNSYTTYGYATSNGVPTTNRLQSLTVSGNTTNFSYDAAGNLTAAGSTTYQWDAANRLKSVNNGSLGSYGYDGNGKRIKKTESGNTIYYVYSSVIGWPLLEVTAAGVHRAYVMYGASVIAEQSYDGNFYWVHKDHLGSGRKLTNTSGAMVYRAEYDPYGKLLYEWSSTNQPHLNSKKFTGYERDAATGLDYAEARMYSSEWGRFMSPDPAGLSAANLNSPQSLNRYSYVDNDPINFNDPEGLTKCGDLPFLDGIFQGYTLREVMSRTDSAAFLMAQLTYHEAGTIYTSDRVGAGVDESYFTELTAIVIATLNQWWVDNNQITVYKNGQKECPLGQCGNRSLREIIMKIAIDPTPIFDANGKMRDSSRTRLDAVLNRDTYSGDMIHDINGNTYDTGCAGMVTSAIVVSQVWQGIRRLYVPDNLILLFWNKEDVSKPSPSWPGFTGVVSGRPQPQRHAFWALSRTPPPPPAPSRVDPGTGRTPTGRTTPGSRGII